MTYLPEPTTAAEVWARVAHTRSRAVDESAHVRARARAVNESAAISAAMQHAHEFLADLTSTKRVVPHIVRSIVASVAMEHGVKASEIMGRSRNATVHAARRSAMVRVRDATGASTSVIGKWFDRDHSTVVFAIAADERREARLKTARSWFTTRSPVPTWAPEAVRLARDGMAHASVGKMFGVSKHVIWRLVQRFRADGRSWNSEVA